MATATHYDAFDLLEQMFSRPQAARCAPVRKEAAARVETRLIRMDVSETEQSYTVSAELPGVKKEFLEVRIEGKQVFIQGQIPAPTATAHNATTTPAANSAANPSTGAEEAAAPVEAARPLLNERFYGKLERRIQLPQEIDETLAEAKFADGILQLQLPKKAQAGVRKLEIQ